VNKSLLIGLTFYTLGHTLSWFTTNLQFVSEWWKDHPVLLCCLISIPTGLCYLYGTKHIFDWTPQLWTSRFLAFSVSYVTFPLMTWYFLAESPFTLKTIICTLLAFTIVFVQLFMK